MNFIENGKEGRAALALVVTKARTLRDGLGAGGTIRVQSGHIRMIRLIAQADAGGLRAARRELLALFGKSGNLPSGYRIAEGVA